MFWNTEMFTSDIDFAVSSSGLCIMLELLLVFVLI